MGAISKSANGDPGPTALFPVFELPVARRACAEALADEKSFIGFPADYIPEIVKRLPPPMPDAKSRQLLLSAWPLTGYCRVVLAVRRNALPDIHTWYWAIESSERID